MGDTAQCIAGQYALWTGIVSCRCEPFRFAEWQLYHIPEAYGEKGEPYPEPEVQINTHYNSTTTGEVMVILEPSENTERWVYEFRQIGDNTCSIEWSGEYQIAKNGKIGITEVAPLSEESYPERDIRPQPIFSEDPLQLEYVHAGLKLYHYFFVSRIRLPAESIRFLRQNIFDLLPKVDLSNMQGEMFMHGGPKNECYLRVVDPITIASNLGKKFRLALEKHLDAISIHEGQDAIRRQEVKDTQQKFFLASTLTTILDSSPDNKDALEDYFEEDGEKYMRLWLKEYREGIEQRGKAVEQTATALCIWLRGELLSSLVFPSYLFFENEDFAKFINDFSECVECLLQSTSGRSFLAYVLNGKDKTYRTIVSKYLIRKSINQKEPSTEILRTGKLAASGIANLWFELAPLYLKERKDDTHKAAEELVKSLEEISGLPGLFTVETTKIDKEIRRESGVFQPIKTTISAIIDSSSAGIGGRKEVLDAAAVEASGEAKVKLEQASQRLEKWGLKLGKASRFMALVDVVNVGIALIQLSKEDDGLSKTQGIISAVGSLSNDIAAFQLFFKLSTKSVKILGAIGGICGVVDSAFNVAKMANRDDYTAMTGYIIAGTGSILLVVGIFTAKVGLSTSYLGVGAVLTIIGVALSIIGFFIAFLWESSDMQAFVAHCEWGEDRLKSGFAPDWADKAQTPWTFEQQSNALINLLARFGLREKDVSPEKVVVEVSPGTLIEAKSIFLLEFEFRYSHSIFKPIFEIYYGHPDRTRVNFDERCRNELLKWGCHTPIQGKNPKVISHNPWSDFYIKAHNWVKFIQNKETSIILIEISYPPDLQPKHYRDMGFDVITEPTLITCKANLDIHGNGSKIVPFSSKDNNVVKIYSLEDLRRFVMDCHMTAYQK